VFDPKVGDRMEGGEPIGTIHARDEDAATAARRRVLAALSVSDDPVEAPPLVHGWHGTDA
jgi:thymidine phosphorylase